MLIFNFHHVEPSPLKADRKHITITPEGLANFIRLLRSLRFKIVSMRDVLAAGGPEGMSRKDVLLTFDDGFENNYRYAVPVLEQEKCPATIFVLAGKLLNNMTNDWDHGHLPEDQRDRLMTLTQMKVLADSPYVTFGSHGLYHRQPFTRLTELELHQEIRHSYTILSEELGKAFVPVLAYPWGEYSESAQEALQSSPYQFAFTTDKHRWTSQHSPYAIPRYSAYFRDGNPLILLGKLCRHKILFG